MKKTKEAKETNLEYFQKTIKSTNTDLYYIFMLMIITAAFLMVATIIGAILHKNNYQDYFIYNFLIDFFSKKMLANADSTLIVLITSFGCGIVIVVMTASINALKDVNKVVSANNLKEFFSKENANRIRRIFNYCLGFIALIIPIFSIFQILPILAGIIAMVLFITIELVFYYYILKQKEIDG